MTNPTVRDLLLQALALLSPDPSTVPTTYSARTDRTSAPKPPLGPLGPAGSQWTDPAFGTPLTRVTDSTGIVAVPPMTSYRTPSNLQRRAWSCDGKAFYCTTTSGTLVAFAFDPLTGNATPLPTPIPLFDEPDFHPSLPGVLIGPVCNGTVLQVASYDLGTGTTTPIFDLTTLTGLNLFSPRTYVRDVGIAQNGSMACAVFGGTGQDLDHFVVAFDPESPSTPHLLDTLAGTIDGQPVSPAWGWGWHVHGAWLDKSGRYLTIQGAAEDAAIKGGLIVWDLVQGTVQALSVLPGGHIGVGYGVMVNQDAGSPWDAFQFQHRAFSTLSGPSALMSPVLLPEEIYLDSHTSWHNGQPDNGEPFVVGTYRYTFLGGANPPISAWRAWDDEILAVSPTAPATVYRFCQHRSDPRYSSVVNGVLTADPTKASYFWASPRPQVSPDGRWVLFTSNWEQTLGIDPHADAGAAARQDVFLAKLA